MGKAARNRRIRKFAAENRPEGITAKSYARQIRRKVVRVDVRNP